MAVRSDQQGAGIGKNLIRHGLNDLQRRRVEVVLTYGDPAYYQQSAFSKSRRRPSERRSNSRSLMGGWVSPFTENSIDAIGWQLHVRRSVSSSRVLVAAIAVAGL